jgi:hypothetical protein
MCVGRLEVPEQGEEQVEQAEEQVEQEAVVRSYEPVRLLMQEQELEPEVVSEIEQL